MTNNKQRTANIGFAKWRVKCFYDRLVQGSSSVFQMKFCAENPPLRQAAETLCVSFFDKEPLINLKKMLHLYFEY
jgi:hypothetical protein